MAPTLLIIVNNDTPKIIYIYGMYFFILSNLKSPHLSEYFTIFIGLLQVLIAF